MTVQINAHVSVVAEATIPIDTLGDFSMLLFANALDDAEHFALMKTCSNNTESAPLVRIHSECITGDVFGSCRCDCGLQLKRSLAMIAQEGGVLIYLRQEGRGIGLANKLKAYALQDLGYDTVEANVKLGLPIDDRNYAVAANILHYLNIDSIRLLTNNPAKVAAMHEAGISNCVRVPLKIEPTQENQYYLQIKQDKMGHY